MLTDQWQRRCSTTSCVDVRRSGAYTEIRNSADTAGPRIWLPVADWRYLLDAIRRGDDELPGVEESADRVILFRVIEIEFSRAEWDVFTAAVRSGDFNDPQSPVQSTPQPSAHETGAATHG